MESLDFNGLNQSFKIPVQVTQDFPPNIEIIENNYDSLVIKCTDDFRLDRVLLNHKK